MFYKTVEKKEAREQAVFYKALAKPRGNPIVPDKVKLGGKLFHKTNNIRSHHPFWDATEIITE